MYHYSIFVSNRFLDCIELRVVVDFSFYCGKNLFLQITLTVLDERVVQAITEKPFPSVQKMIHHCFMTSNRCCWLVRFPTVPLSWRTIQTLSTNLEQWLRRSEKRRKFSSKIYNYNFISAESSYISFCGFIRTE